MAIVVNGGEMVQVLAALIMEAKLILSTQIRLLLREQFDLGPYSLKYTVSFQGHY